MRGYVTGFGKTLRMGFFPKIEFDAWLISSTIELTGRSRKHRGGRTSYSECCGQFSVLDLLRLILT
jgi:hypothetical protein